MASRQAIFGAANEHGDDNEKLVELFKNRAELKKEFAALNKERYRLQQRRAVARDVVGVEQPRVLGHQRSQRRLAVEQRQRAEVRA